MNIKEKNGITLVALVITIVLLLILAAVTIGSLESNGIIGKSRDAKEETNKGQENDISTIDGYFAYIKENTKVPGATFNGYYTEFDKYGNQIKSSFVAEEKFLTWKDLINGVDKEKYGYRTITENEIGESAFKGCTTLTSITIPYTVTTIGSQAFNTFYAYGGPESITIPNTVTTIKENAFLNCFSSINVDEKNLNYSSVDGVLFNKDKTTLIQYPIMRKDTSYEIPMGVTRIGEMAFYSSDYLESIIIPNSVKSIGKLAFGICSNLKSIDIPSSVTDMGTNTFATCKNLTSVTIPNSVTSIGDYVFAGCDSLAIITIPNSVKSIGNLAFNSCDNLSSVLISNSVISIGMRAFSYCTNLTSLTIPSSVTSIGKNAFLNCTSLTSITVGSDSVKTLVSNSRYTGTVVVDTNVN